MRAVGAESAVVCEGCGWGRSAGSGGGAVGAVGAVGEIVLSANPRAVYVQSPMHGVHTWLKVLVWTPETLRYIVEM